MTLAGSGTVGDPWLIQTSSDMGEAMRTPGVSGFYRMTADIAISDGQATSLSPGAAGGYLQKVIDGDGYTLSGSATAGSVIFAGVHFINLVLKISMFGSGTRFLGYNMFATNVTLLLQVFNTGTLYLSGFTAAVVSLLANEFRNVVLLQRDSGALQNDWLWPGGTTTRTNCYTNRPSSNNTGFIHDSEARLVSRLDLLTDSAFSDAAWWQSASEPWPSQTEAVALTLQTITAEGGSSRLVWLESERSTRYLGESDAAGAAQFNARVRKSRGFVLIAAEDFGADDLRANKGISAGYWYLPPADNGFIYQASSAGRITTLDGIAFSDQPVVIDGITFTPRVRHAPVVSARRSVARNGATQALTLDNSGGGGPVLEGDPAYLDGVVEEIHPMLGTVRALANAEVLAFERRGSDYVAMGSAYSNAVGEFRVETEVYGGGDIFAFAADFPGVIWQAGIELNIGDRVRPTVNNGYVYEIITPGNSGATEPQWWADAGDGTEGTIGGATAKARPYYQPVGHGPLKMTLVE